MLVNARSGRRAGRAAGAAGALALAGALGAAASVPGTARVGAIVAHRGPIPRGDHIIWSQADQDT